MQDNDTLNVGRCGSCGYERLGPTPDDDLTRCPKCLSEKQDISVSLADRGRLRETSKLQVRDGRFPSKKRVRREIFDGADRRESQGDFINKVRILDRDKD